MKYSAIAFTALVIFVICSLPSLNAIAAEYERISYDINWNPYSDYDEVVNRASESGKTNIDTWGGGSWKPDGVYAGSFTSESELRIDMLMKNWIEWYSNYNLSNGTYWDYSFGGDYGGKVILAQKVKYTSQQIMSGASMFYIRLPINSNHFLEGAFYILKNVDELSIQNTNSRNSYVTYPIIAPELDGTGRIEYYNSSGKKINEVFRDERFTFYGGNNIKEIAYCWFNTSVTTKSEYHAYTDNGRIYIPLKAPLLPGETYTFVTVGYTKNTISGGQTNIFITPDSISTISWNNTESLIAFATDNNMDEIEFDTYNCNFSLGYSIIFTQGFGDSVSALSYYFDVGDEIHYFLNFSDTNENNKYPTLMFPFLSDNDDNSINISIDIWDAGHYHSSNHFEKDLEGQDYVLSSWNTTTSQDENIWEISIKFKEARRIGIFLTEPNEADYKSYKGIDKYWKDNFNQPLVGLDTSDSITYIKGNNGILKKIFFSLYSPLQFGDGYWTYNIPPQDITKNYKHSWWYEFANAIFCGAVGFVITSVGVTPLGLGLSAIFSESHDPFALAKASIHLMLYQDWSKLEKFARDIEAKLKDLLDIAKNIIDAIGEFVLRVANAIKTVIEWLVEKIQYYGAILLKAGTEIVYFIMFIGCIYMWIKFLSWMRLIARGKLKELTREVEKTATTLRGVIRRK